MVRSAVVTGAAAGIGRATAIALLREGYRVGAFDVDEAGLAQLLAEHGGSGRLVTGLLDVTDAAQWATRLEEFTEAGGGALEVLVNNAGILVAGAFEEIALERQRKLVDVNVTGVLNGCHIAHRYLTRAENAVVVNLCSASAIYGQAELATYSATKFAVRGLTEALDLEWSPQGIRVRAVWPLFVDTGMVDGVDIGSTRSLGVKLTADDVAQVLVETVRDSGSRLPRGVHRPVGRQAAAFFTASDLTPGWLVRLINRGISSR